MTTATVHVCTTCHSARTVRAFGAVSLGRGRPINVSRSQAVRDAPTNPPTATITDCDVRDSGGAGLYVGAGANVVSRRGRYMNNAGGDVVNEGRFESYDDSFD